MGLFGDTFVTGVLLGDDGVTPYAQATGRANASEDDPSFRSGGAADQWAAGATVESIRGLFERAELTGGAANTSLVVNTGGSTITVGGVGRTVHGVAGPRHARRRRLGAVDNYVVYVPVGNSAQVVIADSGASGIDRLVVFGSGQGDTFTLGTGGALAASVAATTTVTYTGVEHFTLYTLGGADRVTVNGTHAGLTTIETGTADDTITVNAIDEPGGRVRRPRRRPLHRRRQQRRRRRCSRSRATYTGLDLGYDFVTVDDTADRNDDDGRLTSSLITGIFAPTGSVAYANLERLDIALGDANTGNRFTIASTHGAPDNLAITNLQRRRRRHAAGRDDRRPDRSCARGAGNDLVHVAQHHRHARPAARRHADRRTARTARTRCAPTTAATRRQHRPPRRRPR